MSNSISTTASAQPTCFVVMGFGKKTDFETGRVLDLNASYKNLIKPAVVAAGLKCIRADEIVHSGLIDIPMYEQLLMADVVVADLSTSNRNAIYEVGVRHALRPYTTVIIAEEGIMKSPFFDLGHIVIRTYRHLGEDIGVNEMRRFTAELTAAIQEVQKKEPKLRSDSPVYKYIQRLTPPSIAKEDAASNPPSSPPSDEAPSGPPLADSTKAKSQPGGPTSGTTAEGGAAYSEMMRRVDEAQKKTDFVLAQRTRRRVVDICQALLDKAKTEDAAKRFGGVATYWVLITLAEAWTGLGDEAKSQEYQNQALALDPPPAQWMLKTDLNPSPIDVSETPEQLDSLVNQLTSRRQNVWRKPSEPSSCPCHELSRDQCFHRQSQTLFSETAARISDR